VTWMRANYAACHGLCALMGHLEAKLPKSA
jgi:hypothetical protein